MSRQVDEQIERAKEELKSVAGNVPSDYLEMFWLSLAEFCDETADAME